MRAISLVLVGLLGAVAFGQGAGPLPQRGRGGDMRHNRRNMENIPPILKRAMESESTLAYYGRRLVTVRQAGKTVSFEDLVWHSGRQTRIEFPRGSVHAGEIMVTSQGQSRHYLPGPNEIEVGPGRDFGSAHLNEFLRPNVQVYNGGMLCNVDTQLVIAVNPLRNVTQKAWIDPSSGMVIKRETIDSKGQILSNFEFTDVEFNPVFHADTFRLEVPGARVVTPQDRLDRLAQKNGFTRLGLAADSPFRLDGGRMVKVGGMQVLVQVYSGQGGRFSLFRVHGSINPDELRKSAHGLRTLSWLRNGENLVIVGDIDEATLQSVARQFGYTL